MTPSGMTPSGMTPAGMTPAEAEREALAGEYVLGTLEAATAKNVEQDLPRDPLLQAAIARWEARLAPLLAIAPPEPPPPDLWSRIEAALPPPLRTEATSPEPAPVPDRPAPRPTRPSPPPPKRPPPTRPWQEWLWRDWLWRGWALGATAVAASLAGLLLLRPPEPPRLMTVLLSQRDQPAWVVESERGALRLAALNPQPVAGDRVLQLWALAQGATAPVSLGLIPAGGRITVAPGLIAPEPGMLIEITLEPPGGSPFARPSGPVQFIGRLAAATGS